MPLKDSHRGREPLSNPANLEKIPKRARKFISADEIRVGLRTQNQDALAEGTFAMPCSAIVKFPDGFSCSPDRITESTDNQVR